MRFLPHPDDFSMTGKTKVETKFINHFNSSFESLFLREEQTPLNTAHGIV